VKTLTRAHIYITAHRHHLPLPHSWG